jgi:hypothetical protein
MPTSAKCVNTMLIHLSVHTVWLPLLFLLFSITRFSLDFLALITFVNASVRIHALYLLLQSSCSCQRPIALSFRCLYAASAAI